jgi:hypothetical protein
VAAKVTTSSHWQHDDPSFPQVEDVWTASLRSACWLIAREIRAPIGPEPQYFLGILKSL